jgi:radical SAM superfamily enzyme YgiQ (UPF0313 family)
MNRNILLINPWIYDFSAYDLWYKPLGLLSLASLLRTNGATVSFIDCLDSDHSNRRHELHIRQPKRKPSGEGSYLAERILKPPPLKSIPRNFHRFGMPPSAFLNYLERIPKPDLVMITSMMTYWYPGLFDIIALINTTYPGLPVVIGGNYVTLCPHHASTSGADFCLSGPGELSLPPLLKDLLGMDMSYLPDVQNLDSYPYPAFDLIRQLDCVPILTSRGCPCRCSYCATNLLNHSFRRRNPVRVADEIEFWHTHFGIKHFSFYDDALLIDNQKMAIPLLYEIVRRRLPVQFHCPNGLHLRGMTPEISTLMYRAGFRTIRFGFETSDLMRQKETSGKVSNKDLADAINHLKRAGYQSYDIGVYILCGLPGQSADEVRESIHYVRSSGARPILAEYSPIPGTELWREAVACSSYPIAEEPLFQNNTLLPCKNASLTYKMYQTLKLMTRIPLQPDRLDNQVDAGINTDADL